MPPTLDEMQLKVSALGADATLNQYRELRREIQGLYADAKNGSEEQKGFAEQLNVLNGQIKSMGPNYESAMRATREARAEKRLFRFAVIELMAPLDELAGKNKQVVQSLQSVIGAALGAKYALSLLGGVFAEYSGPVAIVIGLLTAYKAISDQITQADTERKAALDKLNKSTEDNIRTLAQSNEQSRHQLELILQQRILSRQEALTPSPIGSAPYGGNLRVGPISPRSTGESKTLTGQEYQDMLAANLKDEKELADLRKKDADEQMKLLKDYADAWKKDVSDRTAAEKKALEERYGARGTGDKMVEDYYEHVSEVYNKHNAVIQADQNYNDMVAKNREQARMTALEVYAARRERQQKDEEESQKKMASYLDPIKNGFYNVGSMIQTQIVDKLQMSNSYLGQFLAGLTRGLVTLGVNYLTGGIGSFLGIVPHATGGYITEPIIGRGVISGNIHTFGEGGMVEKVTPMFPGRRDRMTDSPPVVIIQNRIRSTEFYQLVKAGNRIYNANSR